MVFVHEHKVAGNKWSNVGVYMPITVEVGVMHSLKLVGLCIKSYRTKVVTYYM